MSFWIRIPFRGCVLTAGLLAVSAFSAPLVAADRPAEVMHFWISGSEHAALDVIKAAFATRGGIWLDNPQHSNLDLRRVLSDRLATGTAPTALQWQGGAELRDMAEVGMIDDYDALAEKNQWNTILPEAVQDRIKYHGHYFLAPTGLHSENWIFYNLKLLKDHGIAAPRSMAELLDASTKLTAAGITPIAMGNADWEARVMFISVLLSTLGRSDFSLLVEQKQTAILDKPTAAEAIRVFYRLTRDLGSDADRPAGWAEATAAVGEGRSAFIFQGDWAKGELMKLGHRVDVDFGCLLVPGTEDVLSAVIDTFAFPRSIVATPSTDRDMLIETILDPGVQLEFNRIKGSIPVRNDIPDSSLDSCGVVAEKLLRTPHAVIGQPVQTMSTALVSDLHVLVGRMANKRDMTEEQALAGLKAIFRSAEVEARD